MLNSHQEIADLEAEIDELAQAAERCRKVIVLAKVATGAGGLLLVVTLLGLFRSGPTALVLAITAVLGGLALFGSHTSTRDQIRAKIGAARLGGRSSSASWTYTMLEGAMLKRMRGRSGR